MRRLVFMLFVVIAAACGTEDEPFLAPGPVELERPSTPHCQGRADLTAEGNRVSVGVGGHC